MRALPLLDDQLLVHWLELAARNKEAFSDLLVWGGPDKGDLWGPLTVFFNLFIKVLAGPADGVKWAFLFKLSGVLLHTVCSALVFYLAWLFYRSTFFAFCAALLFALFPFHPEAVSWITGRASLLSTLFLLLSLVCIIKGAKDSRLDKRWQLAGLIPYTLSILSSWSMAVCAPWLTLLFIYANKFDNADISDKALLNSSDAHNEKNNSFYDKLFVWAPYLVLAVSAMSFGASLFHISWSDALSFSNFSHIGTVLKDMLFPINENVWSGYAKQYRFLYIFLGIAAPIFIMALVKDATLRKQSIFWLLASLIAILPYAGIAAIGNNLYGSRFLYLASFPFCVLMTLILSSANSLNKLFPIPAFATKFVSGLFVLLLANFYMQHLWKQNEAYKVAAKVLSNIQESARIATTKENAGYVYVKGLPSYVAIAPAFDLRGLVALDGPTGLLSSYKVPDGQIKEILKTRKMHSAALYWDKSLNSLLPFDLSPETNQWGDNLDAATIARRLVPGLIFYKTVSLDTTENCLVLETNSNNGPIITLDAGGLSPIADDLLGVEVKITAPQMPPSTKSETGETYDRHRDIEFYWKTRLHDDYDNEFRRLNIPGNLNDGQYHTYYFPLRSIHWTGNGTPSYITLGFPAGAKAWLKSISIKQAKDLIPNLVIADQATDTEVPTAEQQAANPIHYPFYNFPDNQSLGFARLRNGSVTLNFNASNIQGAASVTVEISKVNSPFSMANSPLLASSQSKILDIPQTQGDLTLAGKDFPKPGLYEVRVIAKDKDGGYLGNFSDAAAILYAQSK